MNLTRWQDTGQRFDFRGHAVFYQQARGEASGTPLLLIHGFPTASWDWSTIWPTLQKRYPHVVAPDLLGFGFSPKPRGHRYSLMEQADLCVALLAHLGIARVHVLAHDYGVSVAQELLARELERAPGMPELASVTLLNGGLFPETHHPTLTQRLLRSPLGFVMVRMMGERRFVKSFREVFGPRTQPGDIEMHDFWTLISADNGTHALRGLIRYIDERRKQRSRWVGALTSTRVPLRLVNGPADPVSGAHMAARYRELVPNPDVVMLEDHIGHYPQVEAPSQTLRVLFEFHDRLESGR